MRFDKLTIKAQELVQNAKILAEKHHNQQIEPEHLLAAVTAEPEGIARSLMKKLGASPDGVSREEAIAIDKLPRVSGSVEVYISQRTKTVLDGATVEAEKMKDEYVSIEHILLAVS